MATMYVTVRLLVACHRYEPFGLVDLVVTVLSNAGYAKDDLCPQKRDLLRSLVLAELEIVAFDFWLKTVEGAFETVFALLVHRNQPEITSWLLTVPANVRNGRIAEV